MSERGMCPLLTMGRNANVNDAGGVEKCMGNKCEWYDYEQNYCAVKSLAWRTDSS